jgi:hypothetical protein
MIELKKLEHHALNMYHHYSWQVKECNSPDSTQDDFDRLNMWRQRWREATDKITQYYSEKAKHGKQKEH